MNPFASSQFNMGDQWPPKYTKFWLHLTDDKDGSECILAFTDPRRIGRVRLIEGDPETQKPLSDLGFDPILNPPTLEIFIETAKKRKVPVKALLLDQKFSSGVGNWIADGKLIFKNILVIPLCDFAEQTSHIYRSAISKSCPSQSICQHA